MAEEPAAKPFYSVLVLAFACSALVASAAVGLRPLQEANRQQDQKKNILYAAGLFEKEKTVEELFAPIETKIIELASGLYVPEDQLAPESYNQLKAALTESTSRPLNSEEDLARLRRIEKYSFVYLVRDGQKIDQIVLPVRGKGLWSTMYAYAAIDADLTTVRGISFYEHGETPGLGGEIENRKWQEGWRGKQLYDATGKIELELVKGKAAGTGEEALHQIDGLSGATLTAKGVNNLMEFWFGDHGYKPYFNQLKNKDKSNG